MSILPGASLPVRIPPEFHGSRGQEDCIEAEIEDLLRKEGIRELAHSQHRSSGAVYSTLFTVPKPGGKFRPCLNLRPANACFLHRHFKMEGLETV